MKKWTALFFSLVSYSILFSQSSFERHYGRPSTFDEAIGLALAADGHYLVAGTTASLGAGGLDMLLEKVDPQGNTAWRRTWGGAGNDGANQVIRVSSGGFLVSGFTEGENKDRDFAAVRLDEEGNEQWSVIRGAEFHDEAVCAIEMPDGGLLISGYTRLQDIGEDGLLLVRTDAEGPVWEKALYFSSGIEIAGCAAAADGGFFVLLRPNVLVRFDAQGDQLWTEELVDDQGLALEIAHFERTADGVLRAGGLQWNAGTIFFAELDEEGAVSSSLSLLNSEDLAQANSFAVTPEGKLWITASSRFGQLPPYATMLYLADPLSGQVLLTRTAAELGLGNLESPFALYSDGVGEGFLVAGNTFSNATGDNGLLFRADEEVVEVWRRTIGVEALDGQESGRMVVEAADGGFLVAGTQATASEGRNLWLIRTDANGEVLWTAETGSPQNDAVAALSARSDGSFVVAGYHSDTLVVAAVSDNGSPLWFREYAVGLGDGTFGMTTNPANEILLTMPVIQEDEPKGFLMKLNTQGDSLWARYYQPSPGYNATYGIAPSSDGGYFLCGCAETLPGIFAPLLMQVDDEGNVFWAFIYEVEGFFNCLITAQEHPNGDVFANGVSIGSGTRPYVLRATPDGELLREQALELEGEERAYFTWFSALQPSTGYQALFGRKSYPLTSPSQSTTAGSITALNTEGDVEWEIDYGRMENGIFQGGAATSDGGLVAAGTATFDNSQDVWLVKTDADGMVGFTAPLAPPFELALSPNPATDWLQLDAWGLAEGVVDLSVFNLSGQQLYTEPLGVQNGRLHRTLPVQLLAPGSYVLHLRQGRKAMAVKWVKGQ